MDSDKKIINIQKSTRTLFRVFQPIHEWLRLHLKLYYLWSAKPYSRIVHWAILLVYISVMPLLMVAIFGETQSSRAVPIATYDFPRWEWANPKPTGNSLSKITTCSNGTVWAVGEGGTILKSADNGVTYSQEYTGVTDILYSVVCYSPSNIVAVGQYGRIIHYDGSSWTSRATGLTPQFLFSVTVSSTGQFVAVGSTGIILYSDDGMNWSIKGDGLTSQFLLDVAVSSTGQFVAVGSTGVVLYSPDGLDWSIKGAGLTTDWLTGVTVSSTGQFVAVGGVGRIIYSPDGINWSIKADGITTRSFNSVTVSLTGKFVAVGVHGTILYSIDGINWSIKGAALTSSEFFSVTASGAGQFVAVADGGVVLYSPNGIDWSVKGEGLTSQSLNSVGVSSTGHFVAVGSTGIVLHSSNGTDWSVEGVVLTTQTFTSTAVSSTGHFVAVGISGTILYSPNGINWSVQAIGLTANSLNNVAVSGTGYFVAVGNAGTILYSTDGQNWSAKGVGLTDKNLNSVTVSSTGHFVAVGRDGIILYSSDGINWSIKGAGLTTLELLSVTVSSTGQFVAVGASGAILYSSDGINWSIKGAGLTTQTLHSVNVDSTGHFVAVGIAGTILYSSDGINWSIKGAGVTDEDLYSVAVSPVGHFVAVGWNGMIVYSPDGINWSIKGADVSTETLFNVTVSTTGQYMAVGGSGFIVYSPDGINWSIKGTGITTNFLDMVAVSPAGQFVAIGFNGTILYYNLPANATATKLLVQLPSQSFADNTGVFGVSTSVKTGNNVPVKIYATDTNNILDKGNASTIGFTTTDPNDNNPTAIPLTDGNTCVQNRTDPTQSTCGQGTTNFVFHTPGVWTITASDTNNILAAGTSSDITVLPNIPHHPRFSTSSISTPAGVASKVTMGLADLYDNATSDESNDRIIKLESSSSSARFSTSETGPWTETLDLTVLKGDATIESETANKIADFYYVDFAQTASTITASEEGLASKQLPVTIGAGVVDQNASSIVLSSNTMKAGETITATVTASTTTSNPALSLYYSRENASTMASVLNYNDIAVFNITAIHVTPPTFSNKTTVFNISSTVAGTLTLSAKSDSTWLQNSASLTVTPESPSSLNLDDAPIAATAGDAFPLKVTVSDKYGNATGAGSILLLSSSDQKIENLPNSYSLRNNESVALSDLILKTAGEQTITARLKSDPNITATTAITVSTASLSTSSSYLSLGNLKPILGKGNVFVTVQVVDAYSNPIPNRKIALYFDDQYFKDATSKSTLTSFLINRAKAAPANTNEYLTDSSGKVTFELEPLKTGQTSVYAKDTQTGKTIGAPIEVELLNNTLSNNISSLVSTLQNSESSKAIARVLDPIVAVTVALGLIPLIANVISGAPAALHALGYGISLSMEALGVRRKRKKWGKVYNSITGKGVDLALVRLYDQKTMKIVNTIVTGLNGFYNFQPVPGTYVISVSKDGFVYPTQVFAKYGLASVNKRASKIDSHYLGQPISITEKDNLLNIDIPIDPKSNAPTFLLKVKIWTEDVYHLASSSLSYIFTPTLIIGTLLSAFTAIVLPGTKNMVVAIVYLIITLIYSLSRMIKSHQYGTAVDTKGKPISGVMISIFDKEHDTLKESRITDRFGRFSIFADPGTYTLKAEKQGYEFEPEKIEHEISKNRAKNKFKGGLISLKKPDFIRFTIVGSRK